jgi:hypothetical protein
MREAARQFTSRANVPAIRTVILRPSRTYVPRAHGLAAFFQHLAARPAAARRPDGANDTERRVNAVDDDARTPTASCPVKGAAFGPPFLFDTGNGVVRGFSFQKVPNCDWHGPRSHINRVGPIKTTDQVPAEIVQIGIEDGGYLRPSSSSRKTSPWRITATTLPVSGSTI